MPPAVMCPVCGYTLPAWVHDMTLCTHHLTNIEKEWAEDNRRMNDGLMRGKWQ